MLLLYCLLLQTATVSPDTSAAAADTATILLTTDLLTRVERVVTQVKQGPKTIQAFATDSSNYAHLPHALGPFEGADVGNSNGAGPGDAVFDLGKVATKVPTVATAFRDAQLQPAQYLSFVKALISAEATDTMEVLLEGMMDNLVGPADTNNIIWKNVAFVRAHRPAIDALDIPLPASGLQFNGGKITHFLDTAALARHIVRFRTVTDSVDPSNPDPFLTRGFLDSTESPGPAAGPPLRVLFIGNSLTYFNAMPRIFSTVAAQGLHRRVVVGMVTLPGASPLMLWATTDVSQVIADLPWDVIVVQLRPNGANTRKMFLHYGSLYAQAIAAHHAKPVLWTQWAGPETPAEGQAGLDSTLAMAAKAAGAAVAPVPEAWDAVQRADSGIWQNLFYPNAGIHPSAFGSYLESLVMYRTITGKSPVGLTHAIGTETPIPDRTASILQQAALSATAVSSVP